MEGDPIVKALQKSSIAQTLKAARASLVEPSRPFTPLDRSLFLSSDSNSSSRPSTGACDHISFVRDTYAATRSASGRSRSSLPETIEEDCAYRGRHRDGSETLTLDGGSSGDEVLTPVASAGPAPPARVRPPKPPGAGYPGAAGAATIMTRSGGYPEARRPSSERSRAREASPHRAKSSRSPARAPLADTDWDAKCVAMVAQLQALQERRGAPSAFLELSPQVWELVDCLQRRALGSQTHAPALLRAVLGLMELKDPKCQIRLSRCALTLLHMETAVQGVAISGVQAAYLNVAKALFKCSKNEVNDDAFEEEHLLATLLDVLNSDSPACVSNDLRVYVAGVLKNISHADANQKLLVQHGGIGVLFKLMAGDQLSGSSKEAQLLIQVTALLRNLASHQYRILIQEDRMNTMTRVMALFPGNTELLTNVSRILAKVTLHGSACEAYAKSDAHIRQITKTVLANDSCAPLVLRLAFVLGNFTARSDRLRILFAFDCEGTTVAPQLLAKYWRQDRQLARTEEASLQETEDVLIKIVRLIANIAISSSAGTILASSSAVVDPLLDMLGAKRIAESEELVLNVVAAITNLLFYDTPSNLLFSDENKRLLCRLFRPLLLESYNVEALVETARALGNLSRHVEARRSIAELRLDEILVILLDHDDRDLVFYVCGALVNLAADSECTQRLTTVCRVIDKLRKLLSDAPTEDSELQLVAVKVLTNLSLDPGVEWTPDEVHSTVAVLKEIMPHTEDSTRDTEQQQIKELTSMLLARLPDANGDATDQCEDRKHMCHAAGCGRRFDTHEKLAAHMQRRHPDQLG